nr:O-antigen ligase family protein [uncultured Flavobacterium sp.]
MISKKNIPIILFAIVLLCEIYLSSYKVNFAIQFLFLLGILNSRKNRISYGFITTILPLLIILLIGFLGYITKPYELSFFIKDVIYFLKPIIALLIGYLLFKNHKDFTLFFKTIICLGIATALVHLIGIFVFADVVGESIHELRGDFGLDNFIEIVAFYLLFHFRTTLPKTLIARASVYRWLLLLLLLVSIFMYFSRTMLVVFFLIGLSMTGYTRITSKALKIVGVMLLGIGLLYTYLYSVKIERNSQGIEAFMYKIKIAPEEIFKSKIDRENHKELWDHWRAYEAKRAFSLMNENPESYVIGAGHGSLVNLKFKAPLGEEDMRYISRLHNGYVFVLYKTGFFGLLLMFVFLIQLYRRIYNTEDLNKNQVFIKRTISGIGLFYLFTSLIITGIYIPRDAIVFILGGLISFEKNQNLRT